MTEAEAESALKSRLAELLEQDRISSADRAPVTLQQDSVGRLSRMDAMQQQSMAPAAGQRRNNERLRLEAALLRLEEGEWGYCLSCGNIVGEARLANDPAATQCIGCAR